jgi:hypothetical protein
LRPKVWPIFGRYLGLPPSPQHAFTNYLRPNTTSHTVRTEGEPLVSASAMNAWVFALLLLYTF